MAYRHNPWFPYHIVAPDARYVGSQRGREERIVIAVCGAEVKESDPNACNLGIANPDWDYNWCRDCVLFYWDDWTEEGKAKWQKKGISPASG